jgi:hypothetical protein
MKEKVLVQIRTKINNELTYGFEKNKNRLLKWEKIHLVIILYVLLQKETITKCLPIQDLYLCN